MSPCVFVARSSHTEECGIGTVGFLRLIVNYDDSENQARLTVCGREHDHRYVGARTGSQVRITLRRVSDWREETSHALVCEECAAEAPTGAVGWRAYLTVGDEDAEDAEQVAVYCPACAAREFCES